MNLNLKYLVLLIAFFLSLKVEMGYTQVKEKEFLETLTSNLRCLNCHGQVNYSFYNEWIEKKVVKSMNPTHVVDPELYYNSHHGTFKCLDCHSPDYSEFPHDKELRMEPISNCLDCHEGDESTKCYNFELLKEEHEKSVHVQKFSESFDCRMCHNVHNYHTQARKGANVKQIIAFNNRICLDCHNDQTNFSKWSQSDNFRIADKHEWLPNRELHFKSVRCIECHAENKKGLLIGHNIRPKEEAVRRCEQCHSESTMMKSKLYKNVFDFNRTQLSEVPIALESIYVIGAPRNPYMKWGSISLLLLILLAITSHIVKRIIKRK